MPRLFAPISKIDLQHKVEATLSETDGKEAAVSIQVILEKLKSDIKVDFNTENWEMEKSSDPYDDSGINDLLGYNTLENGFTFLGLTAGGDWEHPVFFCIYWDGRKLRAYVPAGGNPWNTLTKRAYGNDDKTDIKSIQKNYPGALDGKDLSEIDVVNEVYFDAAKILQDIKDRILPPNFAKLVKVESQDQPAAPASEAVGTEWNADAAALFLSRICAMPPHDRADLMELLHNSYCGRCGNARPCDKHQPGNPNLFRLQPPL